MRILCAAVSDPWSGRLGPLHTSIGSCSSVSAVPQLLLCYGAHGNLSLLLHYGFALDDNAKDRVLLSPTEGIFQQASASASGGAGHADSEHYLRADGRPSWHLLVSLRLAALTKEQRKKLGHVAAGGGPVSDENEARRISGP